MSLDPFSGVLGAKRGASKNDGSVPQYGDPGYKQEDGYTVQGYQAPEGVLHWPRQDGRICYRDNDGVLIESFYIDDPEWEKFASYFSVNRQQFANADLSELLRQADEEAEERNITSERKFDDNAPPGPVEFLRMQAIKEQATLDHQKMLMMKERAEREKVKELKKQELEMLSHSNLLH